MSVESVLEGISELSPEQKKAILAEIKSESLLFQILCELQEQTAQLRVGTERKRIT